jgi:hypothetical protein
MNTPDQPRRPLGPPPHFPDSEPLPPSTPLPPLPGAPIPPGDFLAQRGSYDHLPMPGDYTPPGMEQIEVLELEPITPPWMDSDSMQLDTLLQLTEQSRLALRKLADPGELAIALSEASPAARLALLGSSEARPCSPEQLAHARQEISLLLKGLWRQGQLGYA